MSIWFQDIVWGTYNAVRLQELEDFTIDTLECWSVDGGLDSIH